MQRTLEPGASATERIRVENDRTIAFMGEAGRVYSTPAMVNDVEYACMRLIQSHLDEGESSVGLHVSMEHLAPTPVGDEVTVEVTVTAVEGRRISLAARVHDSAELVGRGTHVRHVVDIARQTGRVADKARAIAAP